MTITSSAADKRFGQTPRPLVAKPGMNGREEMNARDDQDRQQQTGNQQIQQHGQNAVAPELWVARHELIAGPRRRKAVLKSLPSRVGF